MWKAEIDYSQFKTFMKPGKSLYPRHKPEHAYTFAMAWTPAISTPFKLYTDFHLSLWILKPKSWLLWPHIKNLLDQQSTRLTLSLVLYTSEILLLHSTRSQSKFGLHSLVLQPCPVQREQQQLHHRLFLWWALQDKGPPKHLKITIHYGEKGKSHALLSLGPLLSWKP